MALRIAIDGPSGAGKSTVAREVARRLGLPYVDTGAMYRAVAWKVIECGAREPESLLPMLRDMDLEVECDPDCFRVLVDGRDITAELRRPEIGKRASEVAALQAVRDRLVPWQHRLAAAGGVVEGRDIGTVVLPDADFKFFVTANEGVRLRRRADQLWTAGSSAETEAVAEVEEDIRGRDCRDRTRSVSPLRPAADAILIDTSHESSTESVERVMSIILGGLPGEEAR